MGAARSAGSTERLVELTGGTATRARAAALALLAALLLSITLPAAAGATAVTRDELATLAEQAPTDPAALQQLREVDSVDGRPYAVEEALAGASGDELDARLAQIAQLGDGDPDAPPPDDPREEAGDILSGSEYEGGDVPRPFQGVLEDISDALSPIGEWIEGAFEDIASVLPGGETTLWVIVAAMLLTAMVLLGSRTLRTYAQAGAEARMAAANPERDTPSSLERAADRAERDGDLEAALRLRFRAGLLRLDERDAIRFRPSISTREVSRALRSPEFDQLAALFDGVVYGGDEPTPADIEASRRGWSAVLKEAGR